MAVDYGVYLVTQESLSRGRTTNEIVRASIAGGVDIVQLREKNLPVRQRYAIGRKLRHLTREADIPFIVNDRVDLALALDADGVHLGDEDLPVPVARNILGKDAIIGRSVSTVEEARAAERMGADYLGVGAIFGTDSKENIPESEYAIGIDTLSDIVDQVDIPVVGIGGITPDTAGDVIRAGGDGVAVISAITRADDPEDATTQLADIVEDAHEESHDPAKGPDHNPEQS